MGHLSNILVADRENVIPGMAVAEVGNSGNCYTGNPPYPVNTKERAAGRGAHLHLSVYKANDYSEIWNVDNYRIDHILHNPFDKDENFNMSRS